MLGLAQTFNSMQLNYILQYFGSSFSRSCGYLDRYYHVVQIVNKLLRLLVNDCKNYLTVTAIPHWDESTQCFGYIWELNSEQLGVTRFSLVTRSVEISVSRTRLGTICKAVSSQVVVTPDIWVMLKWADVLYFRFVNVRCSVVAKETSQQESDVGTNVTLVSLVLATGHPNYKG